MFEMRSVVFLFVFFLLLPVVGAEKAVALELKNEISYRDVFFVSIDSVVEDNDQNIFVLDAKVGKIHKFSNDGKLLISFAGNGLGPGDMNQPRSLQIRENRELIVNQDMFLPVFSLQGKTIRQIKVPSLFVGLHYLNEDCFYGFRWSHEEKKQGIREQVVFNKNNVLEVFNSIESKSFSTSIPDETGRYVMHSFFSKAYSPYFLFSYNDNRKLAAIGISNQYRIRLFYSNEPKNRIIERNVAVNEISEKERLLFEKEIETSTRLPEKELKKVFTNKIPKKKNLLSAIILTNKNTWVFLTKKIYHDDSIPYEVDVFAGENEYIGSFLIKDVPVYISDNYMYFMKVSDEGDLGLSRYSYKIQ